MKLKPGDKAPYFEARNQDGRLLKLSDFQGKKLVLYFYPKDNTPTCTVEACNLRDNYTKFRQVGYEILGVSTDSEKSHQRFREKFKLPFDLLEDTGQQLVNLFDVWGEKFTFGKHYMGLKRTTFVIDENGIITDIIEDVKSKNHSEQILGA
ncbi:MAG: thioredoxin-dependent thiol peroxidase [Leadbetterella sp.]|nr:thioredoxin-dependent thiol peroxidase [Leadbetterella sp.]